MIQTNYDNSKHSNCENIKGKTNKQKVETQISQKINPISLCVCDGGFGGWGKGEAGEAAGDFFRIFINSVSLSVEVLKPISQIVKVK